MNIQPSSSSESDNTSQDSDEYLQQDNHDTLQNIYHYNETIPQLYELSCKDVDEDAINEVKNDVKALKRKLMIKLRASESDIMNISASLLFNQTFFEGKISELIHDIINSRLHELGKQLCDEDEIKMAVSTVFASAFYHTSVSELLDVENKEIYKQPAVDKNRMLLLIRSLEGSQLDENGRFKVVVDPGDVDIDRMEAEFSSIYCNLAYVPGMSLSADDDLTRQRSRRVASSTGLKQINIPGKGMGCVQTTVANPLTNITLASRYSVQGEDYCKTIQILLRRIQRKSHDHLVKYNFLTTIFLDRGYVSNNVIQLLYDNEIHLIGTQKKGKGSPFQVSQESSSSSKDCVQESGILADYWAEKKWASGQKTYHLALREERLNHGKVAMLITTRSDLASGRWSVKSIKTGAKIGKRYKKASIETQNFSDVSALTGDIGDTVLNNVERNLHILTERQSGNDKIWFLARATHFTSTSGIKILQLVGRDCFDVVQQSIQWKQLFCIIGIQLNSNSENNNEITLEIVNENMLIGKSVSCLKKMCRDRKIKGYSTMKREQIVQALLRWNPNQTPHLTKKEKIAKLAFESWCMKPCRATVAMTVGTRNEDKIRNEIPSFLEHHGNIHTIEAREYGLIKNRAEDLSRLATSPDMIGALYESTVAPRVVVQSNNEEPNVIPVVYEFKTFISPDQVAIITEIAAKYTRYTTITICEDTNIYELNRHTSLDMETNNLDSTNSGISKFHACIPWTNYRYQVLHHAAVLKIPVIFVAATKHRIIYALKITFSTSVLDSFVRLFSHISHLYMPWLQSSPICIPQFPTYIFGDRMNQSTVQRYINLAHTLEKHVVQHELFPAAKYVKPKLVRMWNTYKGGTDVMSRVLKNASFSMSSINPKSSILWRFIQMGAVNTYFILRCIKCNPSNYDTYEKWRKESAKQVTYKQVLKSLFLNLRSAASIGENSHVVTNLNKIFCN